MSQKVPTNKLSIYLIKEEYSEHKDILKNFDKLFSKEIDRIGFFYFGESRTYKPSWVDKFFGDSLDADIKLLNASAKATLLINISIDSNKERIFAIPFGYGWQLLNHGVCEERFGLKVVLNTVDSNSLRSIDKENMSSIPKHTREQISRNSVAADFGIDIEQDLIRSITGKSKEKIFGNMITGKDSLNVSTKLNLSNIQEFLKTCYKKYISVEYKNNFRWIDQIAEIKNPRLIEKLKARLIQNIKNNQLEKTWMAVPEIVDWADVLGFANKNSKKDGTNDDIHLSNFIDSLSESEKNDIPLDVFKKKKIYCFSVSNDEVKHQWTAYNCLYCEINDGEKTYILSNGKWFEVEKDFASQVNSDFQKVRGQITTLILPNYNHRNENDYNKKVAAESSEFCCMDGQNIIHGGGYSKIEFCDLFSKNNKIIHVKHYGGSAVLGHLFSQGEVSGELFLSDEDFRTKVNNKLPDSHKIKDTRGKPNPVEYEIIFGIISSSQKELEIPFFSKVRLRNAKRRLETYGYKVSLQKISVEN